jgi:hypothetical protein
MQEKSTLKTFLGKQFKVLIILILCFNHAFSQNENYPYETQIPCGGVEELSNSTAKTYYCSPIGTDYTSDYQL